MNLGKIAWRSIEQRSLSSMLTALSMALGVALVVAVLVIYGTVRDSFQQSAQGYDLVVGAKGGKLQLVLNTLYHLSQPIENIPWSYYQEFTKGQYASLVSTAIPICLGDNFRGFRVVGTVPAIFEEHEYAPGRRYEFRSGENFRADDFYGAVVGSVVAGKTGLKVGDQFQPTHGIDTEEGQGHEHEAFHIVGVLAPTGTPNDRAVFVNIEGFFLLDGHAKPVAAKATAGEAAAGEAAGVKHDAHEADTAGAHEHDAAHEHDGHEHDAHEADTTGAHEHDAAHEHDGHEHDAHEADTTGAHEHDAAHEHDGHEHDAHEAETAGAHEHGAAHEHDAAHEHGDDPAHDHDHDHADAHDHDHAHDHAHDHDHHRPLPEEQREVTALLVRSASPIYAPGLFQAINEGNVAQAVYPIREVASLFDEIVGNIQMLLLALAAMVVVVSALGMMVSIYNSMSDRRREIGIMRALGARRSTVMWIILIESVLLAVGGGLLGLVLGHGGIGLLNPWIEAETGVSVGFLQFEAGELLLILLLAVLASLVGLLPAMAAYRTDVSQALSSAP